MWTWRNIILVGMKGCWSVSDVYVLSNEHIFALVSVQHFHCFRLMLSDHKCKHLTVFSYFSSLICSHTIRLNGKAKCLNAMFKTIQNTLSQTSAGDRERDRGTTDMSNDHRHRHIFWFCFVCVFVVFYFFIILVSFPALLKTYFYHNIK